MSVFENKKCKSITARFLTKRGLSSVLVDKLTSTPEALRAGLSLMRTRSAVADEIVAINCLSATNRSRILGPLPLPANSTAQDLSFRLFCLYSYEEGSHGISPEHPISRTKLPETKQMGWIQISCSSETRNH